MKIISGGQTGVDTAALRFAYDNGFTYGGWVPKGRLNEAGIIDSRFDGLVESEKSENIERTMLNVGSSDGTIIFIGAGDSPGTVATKDFCRKFKKPFLEVNVKNGVDKCALDIRSWISREHPCVINVAGPRESEVPGIDEISYEILRKSIFATAIDVSQLLVNIRHWDTVRWIVPFWYFSATLAIFAALSSHESNSEWIIPIGLVLWSFVGFLCAKLIGNTMMYHDRQREQIITRYGENSLDIMSDVIFGGPMQGWATATRWFWAGVMLVGSASLFLGTIAILELVSAT